LNEPSAYKTRDARQVFGGVNTTIDKLICAWAGLVNAGAGHINGGINVQVVGHVATPHCRVWNVCSINL